MRILFFCLFFGALTAFSQDILQRSDSTTTIDGVEYYVHTVQKGETAYAISKLYNVDLELFYEKNPYAAVGIRMGEPLLIPVDVNQIGWKPQETTTQTNLPNSNVFYIYHNAQKNETFHSIAQIYQVKPDDIRKANPELKDIEEGASVRIPYDQETLADIKVQKKANAEGQNVYVVHAGETLWSIAQRLHTTVEALTKANPSIANGLKAGDIIKIPDFENEQKKPELPPKKPQHIVKQGETVYSISRDYGISIDSLLMYNRWIFNNRVAIGDTLIVPYYKNVYGFIEYVTTNKEALSEIANRFQVPLKELEKRNPSYHGTVPKEKVVFIPVKQKEPAPAEQKTPVETKPVSPGIDLLAAKDSLCIGGWDTEKTFTVALMLPFSLNKLTSSSFSSMNQKNKVSDYVFFKYIQFYQATLLSLDKLAEQGINIRLNVYDVSDQAAVNLVLANSELAATDLIIGIIFKTQFPAVASFAKQHNIPIVNVLSRFDNIIEGYPNVVKIQPDEDYAIKKAAAIVPKGENVTIVIVTENDQLYATEVGILRNIFPNAKSFSMNGVGMASVVEKLDSYKENYIFAFAKSEAKILDLMRVLDGKRKQYKMNLVGYPNWKDIQGIDYQYVQNLRLHFVSPLFVDYDNEETKQFIYQFRARFNDEPRDLAFEGYDISNFFISNLAYFGKSCLECSSHLPHHFISTGNIVLKNTPGSGYENSYWNIYTIENYKMTLKSK